MNFRARGVFTLILGSFFVSGIAGLVYQVVWTRYLALFLGHTSYAVIAVLAAFMGGLALGNAWLGAKADRVTRPLLFYAGLELGISAFAAIFPAYYDLVHQAFLAVVRGLQPTGILRLSLQFIFAGLTILVPTVLMGATLPALTRFVTRSLAELRGKVAALYAINSSGAVLGVVLAEWWWIPSLGLHLTLFIGAALSFAVGLVALILSRRVEALGDGVAPATVTSEPAEQFTPRQLRLAVVAIGVSGFVAMLYEVAWTRLLALALGSSTHAYSLMLATFISGIAVGGWLVYRWKRQAHTLAAFAVAELVLAFTLFVSLWFYDLLPWWFVKLAALLARSGSAYPLYEWMQAMVCFGVMFVPAVCLGTTLPLVSRVATVELTQTGRSVGRVFAVNTVGTVLGAVVTGLVFLPQLGLAPTFVVGIALNALIGLAIFSSLGRRDWRPWAAAGVVVGVAIWGAATLEPRWRKAFTLGLWRFQQNLPTLADYRKQVDRVDLRYYRDGAGSSVGVSASRTLDGRESLILRVNGKADASSVGDLSTQVLLTQLPLLMKPTATNVLVVGLGSGVSVGSALRHSTVKRVDVVEISPEVVTAARQFFSPFNDRALDDPRVQLSLEDAKTFLQTTPLKYDVIVSEPSNPWMAGVASVFSLEFYEQMRERLNPGGLAAQWLQVYETDDRTVDLVINTFASVFPHVGIWLPGGRDLVLIGSVEPFKPEVTAIARRMEDSAVRADLERVGIRDLATLLSLELVPFGEGAFVPEPNAAVHSDLRPTLEYVAERALFVRDEANKVFSISEARNPRPRWLLAQPPLGQPAGTNELKAAGDLFRVSSLPEPEVFRSQLRRWRELAPEAAEPLQLLVALERGLATPDTHAAAEAALPGFAAARERGDVGLMRAYAAAAMTMHRTRRSAFYVPPSDELERTLRALADADPQNRRVHRARLAEVLWDRGDDLEFLALALKAFAANTPENGPYDFSMDPRAPRLVLARMLLLYEKRGDLKGAVKLIQEAVMQGFVGEEATLHEPLLEHHARRILSQAWRPEHEGLVPP
ncbi:MAG TPA: fused MFS/spermidine synthase [Verrucomicrobiota bacterium]|nr:fused MFS/spermidine synthase [Verrucomicrobiota bacterium]